MSARYRWQRCMLLAVAGFAIGALVYFIDRSPGSVSFLPVVFPLADSRLPRFGGLGGYLPDFPHVYALSLLTAAVLGATSRAALAASGSPVLIGREDHRHVALE